MCRFSTPMEYARNADIVHPGGSLSRRSTSAWANRKLAFCMVGNERITGAGRRTSVVQNAPCTTQIGAEISSVGYRSTSFPNGSACGALSSKGLNRSMKHRHFHSPFEKKCSPCKGYVRGVDTRRDFSRQAGLKKYIYIYM
jgi:hypothetical protein